MRGPLLTLLLLFLMLPTSAIVAGDHGSSSVTVQTAWARATPGPATNGAVYVTIKNSGHHDDHLIKAQSEISERTALHTHIMDNGIAKMRHVEAITIPKMGAAQLKPGGDHIMLMGLKRPLKKGDSITLSLTFKKAGIRNVTVAVKKVGAMGGNDHSPMKHGGGHGDGHGMKHDTKMKSLTITMNRVSPSGVHEALGIIMAKPSGHGVMLHPNLKGLTPGAHAFHVHTNPNCGPGEKDGKKVAALQAGGHYDPSGKMHGHHGMSHKPAGDLPQIIVDSDGTASKPVTVKSLSLGQMKGRALMIHEYPENPKDPNLPKGGGPRFACGVIQ